MNTNVLCDFINEFGIQQVFSVAPESEWPKIYPTVDFKKVHFHRVLTGYLDDDTVKNVNRIKTSVEAREIDIGYRAWRAEPWLGSHGVLKTHIADLFEQRTRQSGLRTDISTRDEDTILGDDWYRFLLNCKYTIGVEGGASLLDPDGKIREATRRYLALHPNAVFEEVEEACFGHQDHSLRLFAISPRHLEACVTKTCQILVEGQYNDILVPGKHYIELKYDFKNVDQVLEIVEKDQIREQMIERAYQDIVESGNYSYERFVRFILEKSLGQIECSAPSSISSLWYFMCYHRMKLGDTVSRIKLSSGLKIHLGLTRVKTRLPKWFIKWIRKYRRTTEPKT